MSTGNPTYGVGGTAQDGGLSTADTVADGGPSDNAADSTFIPTSTDENTRSMDSAPAKNLRTAGERAGGGYATTDADAPSGNTRSAQKEAMQGSGGAHTGNDVYGVGGTAKDGGLSTADTVADGGPDGGEDDGTYGK